MALEVIVGPVVARHQLEPSDRGPDLKVEGDLRVECLLHVAQRPEPDVRLRDPDHALVEALDEVQVVADELGRDGPRRDRVRDLRRDGLDVAPRYRQLEVRGHVELLKRDVLRVEAHLYLGLVDLAHPEHSLPRGDLVPEALSKLCEPLRELDPLRLVEVGEIREDTLAGLRPEVSLFPLRANPQLEHHVEPLRTRELRLAL